MNILVTGGAGFIGSHLIDYLLKVNNQVTCIDDLSGGNIKNIEHNLNNEKFQFKKFDLLNKDILGELFKIEKFDCVFHLAANSDIEKGTKNRFIDLEKNFITTFNILECMKENHSKQIIFASTSAIYGEIFLNEKNNKINENSGPLFPSSLYGASKLAAEAYISAYCNLYNIQSWIFRFPNVVGSRATHGIIFDFINKIKKDKSKLIVLGDGKQRKPYLHVTELINAIIFCWKHTNEKLNYFNIGPEDVIEVNKIAELLIEEMQIKNIVIEYTGGQRGWPGDVPFYNYDISKIIFFGWKPKMNSYDAIRLAIKEIINQK